MPNSKGEAELEDTNGILNVRVVVVTKSVVESIAKMRLLKEADPASAVLVVAMSFAEK
jgi:hypothetical protein